MGSCMNISCIHSRQPDEWVRQIGGREGGGGEEGASSSLVAGVARRAAAGISRRAAAGFARCAAIIWMQGSQDVLSQSGCRRCKTCRRSSLRV
eukprot:365042-Chlamydomonas_euryale.AAC.33